MRRALLFLVSGSTLIPSDPPMFETCIYLSDSGSQQHNINSMVSYSAVTEGDRLLITITSVAANLYGNDKSYAFPASAAKQKEGLYRALSGVST
jgi:hypothetical protein